MPAYVIGNFVLYCVINAFTPGPGNILELNTVTNYVWKKGFLLQFINVKIYLFDMTALTGYVTDYHISLTALVITELFIATLGSFAKLTWIGMGALIQKYYLKHYQIIYILLALTLVKCIIIILK